jgi:hypothetical protein
MWEPLSAAANRRGRRFAGRDTGSHIEEGKDSPVGTPAPTLKREKIRR